MDETDLDKRLEDITEAMVNLYKELSDVWDTWSQVPDEVDFELLTSQVDEEGESWPVRVEHETEEIEKMIASIKDSARPILKHHLCRAEVGVRRAGNALHRLQKRDEGTPELMLDNLITALKFLEDAFEEFEAE